MAHRLKLPPAADGWIGSAPALLRDAVGTFYSGWQRTGDVVRFRLRPLPIDLYLVADPEDVRRVLQEPNFGKIPVQNDKMKTILGEGLFTSEGELWDRQRRIVQSLFHATIRDNLARVTIAATERMLARWKSLGAAGRPIAIHAEMMELTLGILLSLLFSEDRDGEFARLMRALAVTDRHLDAVERLSFVAPRWVSQPRGPRTIAARRTIDGIIHRRIDECRRSRRRDDMLSLLVHGQAASDARMDDRQIRDEVVTLLMGDRITGPLLAWTWCLLATHPAEEDRLRAEIAAVLGAKAATVDDAPQLRSGALALTEVLRLRPPVWLTARMTAAAGSLGGYDVPAGTRVLVSPYITQRHPRFWNDPERFDPSRFAPERSTRRPRFAYFPFGGGRRTCVADSFAMLEAQLIVTTILQRCRLRLTTPAPQGVRATPLLMPTPTPLMRVEWSPIATTANRTPPASPAMRCPVAMTADNVH